MFVKPMRCLIIMFVIVSFTVVCPGKVKGDIYFVDDFEKGPGKWDLVNADKIKILDSGDHKHGKVLCLYSGGEAVYALIKGSAGWTNIRVEGDVYFPDPYFYHYMGLIYHYNVRGSRTDFGSIFILGPFGDTYDKYWDNFQHYLENPPDGFMGNVILVNPHRDSSASRCLYSEYWVTLKDDTDTIKPKEWGHFKAEVVGPVCHFYVGDMNTPKVTFDYFEYSSGRVGFKPRFIGSECWVDNVKVTSIKELSYKGPMKPEGITYHPEKLITRWNVIGPFSKRITEIERDGYSPQKEYLFNNQAYKWEPFKTDARGCVVSGRVCRRFNGRNIAYFYSEIFSSEKKDVTLEFSATHPLVIWVNNVLAGNIKAQFSAWFDFWENLAHKGEKVKVTLNPGKNQLLVLARGARYGGDGFYACCTMEPQAKEDKIDKPRQSPADR